MDFINLIIGEANIDNDPDNENYTNNNDNDN